MPKTAASCSIFVSDRFVLPIDLVDVETMRTYLAPGWSGTPTPTCSPR